MDNAGKINVPSKYQIGQKVCIRKTGQVSIIVKFKLATPENKYVLENIDGEFKESELEAAK